MLDKTREMGIPGVQGATPDGVPPAGAEEDRDDHLLLTFETLFPYLLRKGLLSPADVETTPGARLKALDYSRRNRAFKVIPPSGRGLLVKQGMDPQTSEFKALLAQEARLLQRVATDPGFRAARWFLPEFIHFDPDDNILVTGLVHPATTISKYHLNAGDVRFPLDSAATAARLLAAFHLAGESLLQEDVLPHLASHGPSIWNVLPNLDRQLRTDKSGPRLRLRQQVESAPFWKAIPAMSKEWERTERVVHMDARWENFLLTSGRGPNGNLNMRLIDWETAAKGDTAWDVSYFLSEYLRFWVFFSPTSPTVDSVAALEETAWFHPEAWHDACECFWSTYRRSAKLSAAEAQETLSRIKAYLPFNLTVIAYEALQRPDAVPWAPGIAFELALMASERPDSFVEKHLGPGVAGRSDHA